MGRDRHDILEMPTVRDAHRENRRPNVPAERDGVSSTGGHCGAGTAAAGKGGSELLHARLFENVDFIEEYLGLYSLN